jgi:hypothetical protein
VDQSQTSSVVESPKGSEVPVPQPPHPPTPTNINSNEKKTKNESERQQNLSPITVDPNDDEDDDVPAANPSVPVPVSVSVPTPTPAATTAGSAGAGGSDERSGQEENTPKVDLAKITLSDSLSPTDLIKLLTIICHHVENLEEPLIVKKSYYLAASNPSSCPTLTKRNIDNAMDTASLDELATTSGTIPPEVFTWIVLKVAEEKGSYLLPRSRLSVSLCLSLISIVRS